MTDLTDWSVYPRPQFVRDSFVSLCGIWDFEISKTNLTPSSFSKKITVPYPPESELSGLKLKIKSKDIMFYRRRFTLPDGFIKDRVILHFGAVDQICQVYVNGKEVCRNEGGYLPFSADITDCISDGENEIIVSAKDSLSKKYPYGKQKRRRGGMWYTPVSAIWQPVWLESLPKEPINNIRIEQNENFAIIRVDTDAKIKKLTLKESGESFSFEDSYIKIEPKVKKFWTPETPYLYEFILETENDRIESYFALRSISVKEVCGKNRIFLNGEPYFFSGLLDQGYFEDGIFLPKSPDGYEKDILTAREMGFNMLRKHIKIEPMIFYHLCDKLGMIVFQDMVNNGKYSFILDTALPTINVMKTLPARHKGRETRKIFEEHMLGVVSHLYNSPSVCQYTIFNEGWGQFCPDEMYDKLICADASRIVDSTSGWFAKKKSDVDSRHIYFRLPFIKNPNGKPFFLSEFGGYSLRIDGHLFSKKNYGYKLLHSKEEFEKEIEKLYIDGVLPLIKDGLCATVLTQLSDVEDETNGLMTYDRAEVKISPRKMREINEKLYLEFSARTK